MSRQEMRGDRGNSLGGGFFPLLINRTWFSVFHHLLWVVEQKTQRVSSTSFCIISCQTLHPLRRREQWWLQPSRRKRREMLWNKPCLECSKIQNNSLRNSELCEICGAGCCTFCLHLNSGCAMMNCWDVLIAASQRDVFDRFFVMVNVTLSSWLCFYMFVFIHLLFVSLSQQCPAYHNEIQEAEISLN